MSCCDDPTDPKRVDPRDVVREQVQYGDLVRDLFTDNPEKVLLKLLNESSSYLRELAALRAHYPSVRLRAIELLDSISVAVLQQIMDKEVGSEFALAAKTRLESLADHRGSFDKLFK